MITTDEIAEAYRDLDKERVRGKITNAEFNERVVSLDKSWIAWLRVEHAPEFTDSQIAVVYSTAFEVGHSGGFHKIETNFLELVTFLKAFLAA